MLWAGWSAMPGTHLFAAHPQTGAPCVAAHPARQHLAVGCGCADSTPCAARQHSSAARAAAGLSLPVPRTVSEQLHYWAVTLQ